MRRIACAEKALKGNKELRPATEILASSLFKITIKHELSDNATPNITPVKKLL